MVDEDRQPSHRNNKKFHSEGVVVVVVRCAELGIHEIYSGVRRYYEEDFHGRVVQRHKRSKQVEIARCENHRKHDLRLA